MYKQADKTVFVLFECCLLNSPTNSLTFFLLHCKKTDTVEVITKSMTAAPSGLLLLLAHVQWAPRLATKTV